MSRNVDRLSRIGRIVYPMANVCLIPDCYSGIEFDTATNKVSELLIHLSKIQDNQISIFFFLLTIHARLYQLIYKGKA